MAALPLAGVSVLEIGPGAAAGYCGRLLADTGASVSVLACADGANGANAANAARAAVGADATACNARDDSAPELAYAAYLSAGKQVLRGSLDTDAIRQHCARVDLVLIGEAAGFDVALAQPRVAAVDLSWFGSKGAYRDWRGSDLVIQALTALPQMAGAVEGPPLHAGDRQSTLVAGVTAYIAALSSLWAALGEARPPARRLEVGILESNLVLSEMHMHFFERDAIPMKRFGINRFYPNSPVGVYPCKQGWVGITATTPDQWRSLCVALQMQPQAADERLVTRELRFARLDEVEQAMCAALAARTAFEWAELGRRHKVPIVIVPDAAGILEHPIFAQRGALASFSHGARRLQAPRTPFALTRTPLAARLDRSGAEALSAATRAAPTTTATTTATTTDAAKATDAAAATDDPFAKASSMPLAGLTVVDFAMGWAGPLAGRLLADLGATVLKIEAGRYPDWWRGVNWTAEYIETRQYENAKGYCALNRGKRGVSVDLTTPVGRDLALSLIAGADAIVENQAAGVMAKLGLGYEQVAQVNPQITMLSMSAFGIGNPWSDTRAYGSTLEQGAGLPSFMGLPDTAPTMYQLAYGDPVGGLFGCAAVLTALVHKKRTGEGQFVNLSMIEAMLQFTTPGLLEYQLSGKPPPRRGNRHAVFAPQGIYRCAGDDQWLALTVQDEAAFSRLATIIGQPEWAGAPALATPAQRRDRADEIDAAITAWAASRAPAEAAALLQRHGIAAAPVLHAEQIVDDPHLQQSGFFTDLVREFSGPQRQAGIAVIQDGARLGSRLPAPLMGEHSWSVLSARTGLSRERYEQLVAEGVISFAPGALRSFVAVPPKA